MIRRLIFAAALAASSIASPAIAQDSLATSTAPAPTQVRLPLVRLITDGDRVVMQVLGSTDAPNGSINGLYVGPSGYVTSPSQATDVRGPAGSTSTTNAVPGPMGAPGKSAYQSWIDQGNVGTEADFVAALRGQQGIPGGPGSAGQDGRSAYQAWLDAGNIGTASDFLASLVGPRGSAGQNGTNGADGQSAELRVSGGFVQWRIGSSAWANLIALADLRGADGAAGTPGTKGDKGDRGDTGIGQPGPAGTAATVQIGTVASGSAASVTNSGTSSAAVLNFVVPIGPAGPAGTSGTTPNLQIGTVSTLAPGANATAALRGTASAPILDLGLPAGQQGVQGAGGTAGTPGAVGATPQLTIGTITTGSPGSSASATITGTAAAPVLNLGIPAGQPGAAGSAGATGPAGTAASISIGTVTTLAAGSTPTVTNAGTSSAAVLNFGLPRSAIYLTDVTLAQTAVVAIALGPRQLTVSTNCAVGDRLMMSPAAAMPAGYMLGDIFCSAAGTAQATLYAPLLAIGASYSIVAKVTAFR